MFDINHINLTYQLLPTIWRQLILPRYIYAAFKGARDVWDRFVVLRNQTLYDLNFNGQVHNLTHVLNETFDAQNWQITITDAADVDFVYIGTRQEPFNDLYVGTRSEPFNGVYVGTRQEYTSANSFIINIPNTGIDQDALRALVDKYRVAGKTYSINVL